MNASFISFVGSLLLAAGPALADDPIRLGLVAPLSGRSATDGLALSQGVSLAIEQLNAGGGIGGRHIELSQGDDACDPKQAAVAMNDLLLQRVKLIIGGGCNGSTVEASQMASEQQALFIGVGVSEKFNEKQSKLLFRIGVNSDAFSSVEAQLEGAGLEKPSVSKDCFIRDGVIHDNLRSPSPSVNSPIICPRLPDAVDPTPVLGKLDSKYDAWQQQLALMGFTAVQLLQTAIEQGKDSDSEKIADFLHSGTFQTVFGETRFGPDGDFRPIMLSIVGPDPSSGGSPLDPDKMPDTINPAAAGVHDVDKCKKKTCDQETVCKKNKQGGEDCETKTKCHYDCEK